MNASPRFRCNTVSVCLLSLGLASLVGAEPIAVQSREIQVAYDVNRDAEPLSSVVLWYTVDGGSSWSKYGDDSDRRSPVLFEAPGDGEYGFFVVLENETGPSSRPPTPGTAPQLSVFVDSAGPVVQLHALRESTLFGKPVVQIRWTAVDSFLTARPIEVEYRTPRDAAWRSVTDGPIPNTGRFDWTVPDALTGTVAVRILARDRGGHLSESAALTIELTGNSSRATQSVEPRGGKNVDAGDTLSRSNRGPSHAPAALSGSPRARKRAAELIAEGRSLYQNGDARSAIARLRNAVRLDPDRTDAFVEMAGMFYGLGEWERALSAYEIVLEHQPAEREALLGAALAHTKRKDYSAAGEKLRTILRYDPRDAEVWMNLGDVAIYSGDEVLARDCYMRASQLPSASGSVVEEADKRLQLMDDVSRRYVDP